VAVDSSPSAQERLDGYYNNRLRAAQAFYAAGGRVVGILGPTIPVELIRAAGCFPMRLTATFSEPPRSGSEFMEADHPSELRSIFDHVLRGLYDFADLLVIDRSRVELYYYLKEVVRLGEGQTIPPLYHFDFSLVQTEQARAHDAWVLSQLRRRLEVLTGSPIVDAELRTAIQREDRKRTLMQQVVELKRAGRMSGTAGLRALSAAQFTDIEEYLDLLTEIGDSATSAAQRSGQRLLLVTADELSFDNLHIVLESQGATVVAEDDWWGANFGMEPVPTDPPLLEALTEKYFTDTASPLVFPPAHRRRWYRRQLEAGGIDGVVFHVPPEDHSFGWEYPTLKADADRAGLPTLLIRESVFDAAGQARIADSLQRFLSGSPEPARRAERAAPVATSAPSRPDRRSAEGGKQLQTTAAASAHIKDWFLQMRQEVVERHLPFAVAGATVPHEILYALDLPFVANEWWSGIVAAKRLSGYYASALERLGYHSGLPRYGALAYATFLDQDHPEPAWGGLPKPSLLTARSGTGAAMWQAFADHLGVPFVGLETPGSSRLYPRWWELSRWAWEDLYESSRIDLLVGDIRSLIRHAEDVSGRKLDIDRLRELIQRTNRIGEYIDQAREIVCTAPKCPVRMSESMTNVMTAEWLRGTPWAEHHAKAYRDEIQRRAEAGIAVCPNEQFRLVWVGVGLWQNVDFYNAFEASHGAVFVRSMYSAFAADGYIRYGLKYPLRALASRYASMSEELHIAPWSTAWTVHEAQHYRADGAVLLMSGSSTLFMKRALEDAGIPVLCLSVDAVDSRGWNEELMRSHMVEFIERRLAPRKQRGQ